MNPVRLVVAGGEKDEDKDKGKNADDEKMEENEKKTEIENGELRKTDSHNTKESIIEKRNEVNDELLVLDGMRDGTWEENPDETNDGKERWIEPPFGDLQRLGEVIHVVM